MNYQAFTNDSLTMMYEAIRGGLEADDALKRQGLAIRFRVRETHDWKKHAADLESEMLKRGMRFEVIRAFCSSAVARTFSPSSSPSERYSMLMRPRSDFILA